MIACVNIFYCGALKHTPQVKILYDVTEAEITVLGKWKGETKREQPYQVTRSPLPLLLQPPPTAFTPESVKRRVAGMKQILLMIAVVALVGSAWI